MTVAAIPRRGDACVAHRVANGRARRPARSFPRQSQRRRRREVQQLPDRRPGRLPRAGFEPVAEADQREQPRRFHEIKVGEDVPPPQPVAREGDQAVKVSHARAHGDERVHVARAAAEALPRAAVEARADVNDRDRSRGQGDPVQPEVRRRRVERMNRTRSPRRVTPVEQHQHPMGDFDGQPENEPRHGPPQPGSGLVALPLETLLFDVAVGDPRRLGSGRVAHTGDGGGDAVGVGPCRIKTHDRPPAGEVHADGINPGDRTGGLLDVGDATGAVHPADRKIAVAHARSKSGRVRAHVRRLYAARRGERRARGWDASRRSALW